MAEHVMLKETFHIAPFSLHISGKQMTLCPSTFQQREQASHACNFVCFYSPYSNETGKNQLWLFFGGF